MPIAATPYISEIRLFATQQVPHEWVPCDGRLLPIDQDHRPLFALIGNTYGGAESEGTFAVPDLTDRVAVGISGERALASRGGSETATLAEHHLPPHSHRVVAEDISPPPDGNQPTAQRPLSNSAPVKLYAPPENLVAMQEGVIGPRGASEPHQNVQPYLTVAFYIAIAGLWPTRG